MENKREHTVRLEPAGIERRVLHGTPLGQIVGEQGVDFACGGRGVCGKCRVELLKGEVELTEWHRTLLERQGLSPASWRLACLSLVTDDLTIRIPQGEQQILTDETEIRLGEETGYALAVDLGSTTVVVQLVDLSTGKILGSSAELNRQSRHGADIISRISYAIQGEAERKQLSELIREQIGEQIASLVQPEIRAEVRRVVLVGNSVMHHLFCDLDVTPLSAYPFQSPNNAARRFSTDELHWALLASCEVVFLPNISHFVGSDILAGMESIQIHKQEKWQALIDLGTNGEIVVGRRGEILCTSTAAGPAFEGINITQGMRAVTGAICSVNESDGHVEVIGGGEASGLCGSGLIDAIHYFCQQEAIDMSGSIADESRHGELPLTPKVSLWEKDVREFQLAKAAIATGFQLLLKELGITTDDLEHIYVSGGLGTYLDVKHALAVGLLQASSPEQIRKAGNSALAGCKLFLYRETRPDIADILSVTRHFALEASPDFQDYYCNNLFFMPPMPE